VFHRIRTTFYQDSNRGLAIRMLVFTSGMAGIFGLNLLAWHWFRFSFSISHLIVVFLAVCFPTAVSLVTSERPRGHEWILARLSLVTFCRTGVPLFLVAVINFFSNRKLTKEALGFFAIFYLAGILLSIAVSFSRLEPRTGLNPDNEEV
jgi:hypothetical protein